MYGTEWGHFLSRCIRNERSGVEIFPWQPIAESIQVLRRDQDSYSLFLGICWGWFPTRDFAKASEHDWPGGVQSRCLLTSHNSLSLHIRLGQCPVTACQQDKFDTTSKFYALIRSVQIAGSRPATLPHSPSVFFGILLLPVSKWKGWVSMRDGYLL